MQLRSATARDTAGIRALLVAADLPIDDLATSGARFVVACDETDAIIAAGALQILGEFALLRSVTVAPEFRGAGLGASIVQELERVARDAQLKQLALLTLTAQPFFENLGYHVIGRQAVPQVLQGTEEFRALCPVSAICMTKFLCDA